MKLQVGDTVKVTGGKDKGKSGVVRVVLPKEEKVIVEGVNMYVRHVKPMQGRSGEKIRVERPLPTAKVAIVNEKGNADRIAYSVAKDGTKTRVFVKTGNPVPDNRSAQTENKK